MYTRTSSMSSFFVLTGSSPGLVVNDDIKIEDRTLTKTLLTLKAPPSLLLILEFLARNDAGLEKRNTHAGYPAYVSGLSISPGALIKVPTQQVDMTFWCVLYNVVCTGPL